MTPDPDRPAPDPSPLADRLADLQGSAEWIDARQLTPVIDHAEQVEAELAAARREADALWRLVVVPWTRDDDAQLWKVNLAWWETTDTREEAEALVRKAAGLPPAGRPAGNAGGERVGPKDGILALRAQAEAGRDLARAVLESWVDASLAERCPAESIPATAALYGAALRLLARPIGERDGGDAPGDAPQSPAKAPGTLPADPGGKSPDAAGGGQGGAPGPSGEPVNPGDWPEDFGHENGNYENRCVECGRIFTGHKRRVFCRVCAKPDESPADPDESGPSDRTTGLPGGLAGASSGPASPRPCPFCGSEDAGPIVEGPDDLPRHRVRCPDCWARGPADFDDAEAIGYWNAAWDRRAEAAPVDAPGARAIDAGAVERAVDRIEALSQSPRVYAWQIRESSRADDAEIRRLYDQFSGETGFDEAGRRARMEVFARILRESLGLAPVAGRGGDAKGGRDGS